jgi:hypothetical protein
MSPNIILSTILITLLFAAGQATAEMIDLGSSETSEVHFLDDPDTLVRVPPGAFGVFPPGTYASLFLDAPTCNGPNCIGGRGMLVIFDGRYTGLLEKPVMMQVGYDEASVEIFGGTEEDLVLACFNGRQWVPMEDQVIDTERNVAMAPETQDIRQFVAVFASTPAPVEPVTWGAIKGVFSAVGAP